MGIYSGVALFIATANLSNSFPSKVSPLPAFALSPISSSVSNNEFIIDFPLPNQCTMFSKSGSFLFGINHFAASILIKNLELYILVDCFII